jgi:hypothetical protein
VFLYVDHHDKAYEWAERYTYQTHPTTGAAQLVEIREMVQEIRRPIYVAADAPKPVEAPKPLFFHLSDDELLGYGVPPEWLNDVHQVTTEDEFLALAHHLPDEAAYALLQLATGDKPRVAERAVVAASPFDHPDAKRRFLMIANGAELRHALKYPRKIWTEIARIIPQPSGGEHLRSTDPLLSDDLRDLLCAFPNDALRGLVKILKQHSSWSPFPGPRAYEVHDLPDNADFTSHSVAIANEILWWGSNDLRRQLGEQRPWREVVAGMAAVLAVPKEQRNHSLQAWQIERAVLQKAIEDWEALSPVQREEALQKATRENPRASMGNAMSVAGIAALLSGRQLLSFLAAGRGGYALATTVFAPVVTASAMLWAGYDLAGPSYRVLRRVVLTIAYTRQRLLGERANA